MKFEKFLKSLGSNGKIYKLGDQKWLASTSVFMLIPDTARSVTAADIIDMPPEIAKIIHGFTTAPAFLSKAVMPFPDGGIRDCIRIFSSEDNSQKVAITNTDCSLLEKSDVFEINYKYDIENDKFEAKALMISRYNSAAELELVGMIFPTVYDQF